MENLKKLLHFLSPLPIWLRLIIVTLVSLVVSLCLISCGVTQTVVNNSDSDNASIDMTINPSQSTSTTVTPDIQFQP